MLDAALQVVADKVTESAAGMGPEILLAALVGVGIAAVAVGIRTLQMVFIDLWYSRGL